jgi:hypothetical protein
VRRIVIPQRGLHRRRTATRQLQNAFFPFVHPRNTSCAPDG